MSKSNICILYRVRLDKSDYLDKDSNVYIKVGRLFISCSKFDSKIKLVDICYNVMSNIQPQLTGAMLNGFFWRYTSNGVAINSYNGERGNHDLAYGNSPSPYIDVALSGGVGQYTIWGVVNGVRQHMGTCGPDVSNLHLTPWAGQNGWVLAGNRIRYIP